MTITLRRSAAIAGVVLSVLGLLACLAGAAGVWAIKHRVDGAVTAVFTAADDALEFMASRLVLLQQRIDSTRQQVDGLAARAERLQSMEPEVEARAEIESLRWTLDMLVRDLKAADGWLDSIEAVARGVHSAAASIADSKQAVTSAPAHGIAHEPAGITAAEVIELAGDVADALGKLEVLGAKLLEVRENRILAHDFAAAMVAEAAKLDTRLDNLSKTTEDFNVRVAQARAESVAAGRRVHGWVTYGAIALTAVLLWFGASQVCVLKRAWRLSRNES